MVGRCWLHRGSPGHWTELRGLPRDSCGATHAHGSAAERMTMRSHVEGFFRTNRQGVATMRNRRHLIHRLVAFTVLAGSIGLAAVASPVGAATPNDFLCYVAGSSQVSALGTAFANPMQVELSSTACASPTLD